MKLIVASDIHYGNSSQSEGIGPFTEENHVRFAAAIHAEKPDVLLVTGDCAEGMVPNALSKFFSVYKNPHGISVCVPGNHDMWMPQWETSGPEGKYAEFIKQGRAAGWNVLVDDPIEVDGVHIAGNMCWYDFSSRDRNVFTTPAEYERDRNWSDYHWMGMDNLPNRATPMLDFCAKRMAEFKTALAKVPEQRRKLVVCSHFVGHQRLLTFFRHQDYCQAFMGNFSICEEAFKAKADLYLCGHTHRRQEFTMGNSMKCVNNGSGYGLGSKGFDTYDI